MVRSLRDQVYELLASGRTVAEVCTITAAPRTAVMRLGKETGLRWVPAGDRFIPAGRPAKPSSVRELVARGEASDRRRTQALAGRVRVLVTELERCVLTDEARAAGRSYPVGTVRAWAAEQGIAVPERGRYLPADVVLAWRLAGEPVVGATP